MSGELLLDTGALISLLDRSQSRHREFVEYFESWRGRTVTSEAVVTEATHLLGRVPGGSTASLDFVLAGGAVLVPASLRSLSRCRRLMAKYSDLPMDYADATLVSLAEDLDTSRVFTTDRRDFQIYRFGSGEPFDVVP